MNILGRNYELNFEKTYNEMYRYGDFDQYKNIIRIANDIPEDEKIATVLHEIIEALNYYFELNLEHPKIMSLEAGLFQVLKENGVDLSVLLENDEWKNIAFIQSKGDEHI